MEKNKSKYLTIEVKGKDLDCVKKAVTLINNCIYDMEGKVSNYNNDLLKALLGDNWRKEYLIGDRYIDLDDEVSSQ